MTFSPAEHAFLVSLVHEDKKAGARKAETTKKSKEDYNEFLERACLAYFTNFPIARNIDMDDAEYLWVLEQKKKVTIKRSQYFTRLTDIQTIIKKMRWIVWGFKG